MLDEEIIGLLYSNDKRGIIELKNKYNDIILDMVKSILTDKEDIDKCMTLIYEKISFLIPPYVPKHFRGFILKYARETAIDIYKSKESQPLNILDYDIKTEYEVDDSLFYTTLVEKINVFAGKLPTKDLIIFMRTYFFNEKPESIAELLELDVEKVEEKIKSVTNLLRKFLEANGYEKTED